MNLTIHFYNIPRWSTYRSATYPPAICVIAQPQKKQPMTVPRCSLFHPNSFDIANAQTGRARREVNRIVVPRNSVTTHILFSALNYILFFMSQLIFYRFQHQRRIILYFFISIYLVHTFFSLNPDSAAMRLEFSLFAAICL